MKHTLDKEIIMAQDIKETLENNQSTFGFQDIMMLEKVDGCYFESKPPLMWSCFISCHFLESTIK